MHAAIEWLQTRAAWLLVNWRWWVIPVGTALINLLSRVDTATWERWGATKPRLQALLRLLRAVGIDPHTAVSAVRDLVAAKSAALPQAGRILTYEEILDRINRTEVRDGPPPPTVRDLPPPPLTNLDPNAAPQWWNQPPPKVDTFGMGIVGRVEVPIDRSLNDATKRMLDVAGVTTDTPPETPAAKAEEKP